mmetsp:Transcript_14155/g.36672  ORF Transcript_14155/g.36672 Transcript_14155/m.36672 type:complete len:348 (+) Transcript_14155:1754-2797(+)
MLATVQMLRHMRAGFRHNVVHAPGCPKLAHRTRKRERLLLVEGDGALLAEGVAFRRRRRHLLHAHVAVLEGRPGLHRPGLGGWPATLAALPALARLGRLGLSIRLVARLLHLQARLARQQLLLLLLKSLLHGDEAAPKRGVVLLVLEGSVVELVEELTGAALRGRVGALHLLGAREDVVDRLLVQRLRLLLFDLLLLHLVCHLARILKQLLRAKAQDRGQLLLVKYLGALVTAARVQHHPPAGVHSLDDDVVKHHLLLGALQDVFLHAAAGDKAVDVHRVLLPDAVRTAHGLQVVLGVPVRVKDDDRVGGGEVDAEAARTRGEQEGKVGRALRVEVTHRLLPRDGRR